MFVIIADQINSRAGIDRAAATIAALTERFHDRMPLPIDQTSGDEIQLITEYADTVLGAALQLTRTGYWSVGIGVGSVRDPMPRTVRTATGEAFYAARSAVEAAKRADGRIALDAAPHEPPPLADDVEALVRLLVLLRERRTAHGWQATDLMSEVDSQSAAAVRLGISDAAVSQRLKRGGWAAEASARPALIRLLEQLDAACSTG